jgi:hypothetical protein
VRLTIIGLNNYTITFRTYFVSDVDLDGFFVFSLPFSSFV